MTAPRHVHGGARRLPALIAIAAVLVAGGLADRRERPRAQLTAAAEREANLMPSSAPSGTLTSAWYCPGATGVPNGTADGSLFVANPTDDTLTATLTVVPVQGQPQAMPLTLEPRSRQIIHEADLVQAAQLAALVDFNGGGGIVEQIVGGPFGAALVPCASDASDHWYFPAGSTDRDWVLTLMLFNPFPGDAIVDLSFATDQGPSAPPDFQGLVVPARGMKVVDIGEHVRRRVDVATTVTARTGRVVAGQIAAHTVAPTGLTALLGAPSAGPMWVFPDGLTADGVHESFHIYNPSAKDAQISVEVALDEGEAEPFDLTVPAFGTYTLVANDEARIPKGVAHTVVVRSVNGVGVVAERSVAATAPSPHTGMVSMLGGRRAARQWTFAAGGAAPTMDEWIIAYNPGSTTARVSLTAEAAGVALPIEGLQDIEVPAGKRVALRLGDHIQRPDLPLELRATGPVVAERDMYPVGAPGIYATVGIPGP